MVEAIDICQIAIVEVNIEKDLKTIRQRSSPLMHCALVVIIVRLNLCVSVCLEATNGISVLFLGRVVFLYVIQYVRKQLYKFNLFPNDETLCVGFYCLTLSALKY